ncbi:MULTISPECIES: hypothetical protein [Streptomyces]
MCPGTTAPAAASAAHFPPRSDFSPVFPPAPGWVRAAREDEEDDAGRGDDETGRGLLLVRACVQEWGVCRHGPGPGKGV